MKKKNSASITPEQIKALIDTALGEIKADMVIANADLVNVYSGELLKGYSVAIKGEKIAYVGEKAEHTIGPDTRVIDATGKTLIPGLIDAHAHLLFLYAVDEFLKYAMKGGTTTIITETRGIFFPLGYRGVKQFLEAISGQPIKIFATAPPMLGLGPAAQGGALSPESLRRLLKQEGVVGLGETYWFPVLQGEERILRQFAETLSLGKTLEGHSAGARGNKLVAYIASGISSCHEPTTAEEVLERLRLGIHTMIREGDTRRDLEAIAEIKDEKIDFRRLVLATDGVGPKHLMEHGYMEILVQKAIDLGFDPIVAIQMATINAAEHFSFDNLIGGIAPGKYADMVLIPDLRTIQAEMVMSNGQVIAQRGQILVPPKRYVYPKSSLRSVHLPRKLEPADFRIPVEGRDTPVTVRVIHQVTEVLTREEQIAITPKKGLLEADVGEDILKVAVIERTSDPGKMFVGFVKGFKMRKGAFASSGTWALSGIVVVGTNDEDMAGAVNRVLALQGGDVVYAKGRVLAELPLPVAGLTSDLPIEVLYQKLEEVQQKATELGTWLPDVHLTLTALTTGSIPFFRICEAGLVDIRDGKVVGLMVS
ncbi:MAG TPA: adenine deaminase C-terminal domain-containing protein [Dehalococcoidia bacterium]|nr:adenine deaminase C-terminal domain-containing protein [Dehalococcoidia bacterium]